MLFLLYHFKAPSNSSQALNLILFIFHFPCFHYRSSHGGSSWFNSSSKSSSRFLLELKHSSSCYPECNSFFRIIGDGIMSFLIIEFMFSWFTCCQDWDILNPSISSLELSWVIFHLKPSLRNVAIVVLKNDPSYLFIILVEEVFISSLISSKQLFPLVAGCHLIILRCFP